MPTPEYTQDNLIKKVHIGDTDFYFKDEDLRNFVESFGTAVNKNAVNIITEDGTNLPTEEGVVDYVDNAVMPRIEEKVAVDLDNDEGLVFNYVPASPGPNPPLENPVVISFAVNPQQTPYVDSLNVVIDSVPQAYQVESGITISAAMIPELQWHRTDEPPYSNTIVASWVTDPSDPTTIINPLDNVTTIDSDLVLYTYFEEVNM